MQRERCFAIVLLLSSMIPAVVLGQRKSVSTLPADALMAKAPETPEELFGAVLRMLQLSRPKLARKYLDALLKLDPDDGTILAIRNKFGTDAFIRLARLESLQPSSEELLNRLNAAAQRQLNDPVFQEKLVSDLKSDVRRREAAINTLSALEEQAAVLLVKQIAADPSEAEPLITALVRLGPKMIPPVEAMLRAPQPQLQATAANILGRLNAKQSVLKLLGLAFDRDAQPLVREAAQRTVARIEYGSPQRAGQVSPFRVSERLIAQAIPHFEQKAEWTTDKNGHVSIWVWDDGQKTVKEYHVKPENASVYEGEWWARRSLAVSPENQQASALLLGFLMWRDLLAVGWDQPLPEGSGTAHDLALSVGADPTIRTLVAGLEHGNPAAVLGALQVLSLNGSRSELLRADSPLMGALHADAFRVQFAAATTILQLDPSEPFAGSSQVVRILARSLNATNQPKTVVIDPNADRGSNVAGLLAQLGYEPELASTGQRGFLQVAEQGNVELAVLHLNTVRWDLSQTVANLRSDPRTAAIPIAVYGPASFRNRTQRIFRSYSSVGFLNEHSDLNTVKTELASLVDHLLPPPLTPKQRTAQIETAAFWLRHIAESQRTNIFPLDTAEKALSEAINNPSISMDAIIALGSIDKPSVQARLLEVGLSEGYNVPVRELALLQLAFHIQRFGSQLNRTAEEQVSQAWKTGSTPELKTAWASLVGVLSPPAKAATEEILRHPAAAMPVP